MKRMLPLLALTFVCGMLLAGCQNAADPDGWMDKWAKAGRGEYDGPALTSYDQTPPRAPRVGGYHPGMYVGYSTVNNVAGVNRDDDLAGTFRIPYTTTPGGAGFGYNPTTRTLNKGATLGIRSGVVPPK